MDWQWLNDAIDAAESWLVEQSFWAQVPLLLVVVIPLCWFGATLVDGVVDLASRRRRCRVSVTARTAGAGQEPGSEHPAADGRVVAGRGL